MFLYKLLSYYSICFLVYKIIKSKLKNNIIKKDNEFNENSEEINENNLNKNNKDIEQNKTNLSESNRDKELFSEEQNSKENINKHNKENINQLIIYEKPYNKFKNNIDIDLLNLSKMELKNKKNQKILVENCIYNESIDNVFIENELVNNYLLYNFKVYTNYLYKISVNIKVNNVDNIKIIITDNSESKKYIYNHLDNIENYNYNIKNGISNFSFILDNNEFIMNLSEQMIYIYIYFYKKDNIIIENISCNVIQKNSIKSQDSLIIYNVNNSVYPIFLDVCNILDYNKIYSDKNKDNLLSFL
jgi:hypothetical protein